MIEKFNPQEIEILRRELKETRTHRCKPHLLKAVEVALHRIFNWSFYSNKSIFPTPDILKAMECIIDHTLGLYVQKPYKKRMYWYRSANVKVEDEEVYRNMAKDLALVVLKYKREPDFSDEKPKDWLTNPKYKLSLTK